MATIGPDLMAEAPSVERLGQETTCSVIVQTAYDRSSPHEASVSSPAVSPRTALPPPNPPFVFPARPSSSSAPSSFSRATGRRPRSAIDTQEPPLAISTENERIKPRSPALPAFSFNPGASLPGNDNAFLTPPKSPSAPDSPRAIPVRPAGHRRGGSEFVGGSIRGGDAVSVLGTSPTKSESGMASPMLQPAKPNRPRGHAHRRSAAISSHDLSSIILPSPNHNPRGSSAPASPALLNVADHREFPGARTSNTDPDMAPAVSPATSVKTPDEPVAEISSEPEQLARPPARNRVGFSDTLEFIPRPLSLVSNETSSTITARPGHSVSGSISSVISLTTGDRESHSSDQAGPARKIGEARPSTAGAVLERTQNAQEPEAPMPSPRRRGSIPFLGALPPATSAVDPATPSPTKSVKKWSFFGLEPFVAASPTRSRPASASSSESQKESTKSPAASPGDGNLVSQEIQLPDDMAELKPVCSKKRGKKPKKVKAWAGSILSRKAKARHGKQKRRTSTPPPFHHVGTEEDLDGNDGSCMEMAAEPEVTIPSFMVTDSASDGVDSSRSPTADEDGSYPMIDLDAALGPFNTPLPRNPEWEAAQRAGGLAKKQLHSAAGMSRFTGPGMHYHHRRAESAPEMAPFEAGRLGFPRFGSSSTMADVFEEDEEDEDDGSATKSTGQSTPVVDTPITEKPPTISTEENVSLCSDSAAEKNQTADLLPTVVASEPEAVGPSTAGVSLAVAPSLANRSTSSLHENVTTDNLSVGYVALPRSSLDSAPSPRHMSRPKDLAPVDVSPLNLPMASLAPISPYSMTQSSAFPSPRSPVSYDTHRISTAPSSITEDNFQSLLMGEPGPEVRISVDDIPSLTSSNSTMTRESIFAQYPQARQPPPLSNQPRPASFTSTAFGRRRSSLASLSRLISSSHGERSKLSMEVSMDSEPEKKGKVSKTKRLSRLVQFWKSKEPEST
ncbi:hypothetical protein QBC47DRAFT_423166 [Echria macrotheca]|uniref:Cell wall proline rich protein n=1 Tax=Echria macrotheca TaxID=438768 RepID=A0AAJ0BB07_9PEZI|nr:hypothetical protein QBC47DRAFT_423166 [Echria macrotheca]